MQRITLVYVKVTARNISVSILSSLLDIQHQRDNAIASTVSSIDRRVGGSLAIENRKDPSLSPGECKKMFCFDTLL